MKTRHFFWYFASWYPMLFCLVQIRRHPPVEVTPGDIGIFIGIMQLLGFSIYFGGLKLYEYLESKWKTLKNCNTTPTT